MDLNAPLEIEFEFDGDIQKIVSNPKLIKVSRASRIIPIDFVSQSGPHEVYIFIGKVRIPLNLSQYFEYNRVGQKSTVKLVLEC